jgi:high-affinity iron transporter
MKTGFLAALLIAASSITASAQDNSAKRLSSIVGVAVEEYGKAVDGSGKLISKLEYDETTSFLDDAKGVATRLTGPSAELTKALLDSMSAAVDAKRPPAEITGLQERLVSSLGVAGALDLPTEPLDIARGKALYTQNCASCHGDSGLGDGPAAKVSPIPVPPIGSAADAADLTPTLAYNVVTVGVSGTPMPEFGGKLSPQDRWNIINYIYELRGQKMELPAAPADAVAQSGRAAANSVLALLDSALEFARTGDTDAAGDRAVDAYIAFESLETSARARRPGLVSTMERHFADFKAFVRGGDLKPAQRARDAIALDLPQIVTLSQPAGSGWAAFLQSFLIILREGFEAILVIGAIVAFLIKTGNRARLRSVWTGVGAGLTASAVMAVVLQTVLRNLPTSREIIEGVTMLLAVVVLFSVSYWLISKVEAAKWQRFIQQKVGSALDHGGGRALAVVAFLAVFREGAETALFYQALFSDTTALTPLLLGIVAGAAALAVIFTLFYRFGVKIPMRPFFTVTSVLLYYMAFVFLGKGLRELQEGDAVGITVLQGMPSVPAMGIFPSVETLVAQGILILLFIFMLLRTFIPRAGIQASAVDSKA